MSSLEKAENFPVVKFVWVNHEQKSWDFLKFRYGCGLTSCGDCVTHTVMTSHDALRKRTYQQVHAQSHKLGYLNMSGLEKSLFNLKVWSKRYVSTTETESN